MLVSLMANTNILYGPPGTGKTTYLLSKVEEALNNGTKSRSIGYISYTKSAVQESIQRATEKFALHTNDFPYFQTLHAFCKQQANISANNIVQLSHKRTLCELLGLTFAGSSYESDYFGMAVGDKLFQLEEVARIRQEPIGAAWMTSEDTEVDIWELERFSKAYSKFKSKELLYDFTDILVEFIKNGRCPSLDVLFIDEAQDLSKLQWDCVRKITDHCKEVYIAGDDDQAIYGWNGADVDTFINLQGNKRVLEQSYRLPSTVHSFASNICGRINTRVHKVFLPKKSDGKVEFLNSLYDVDMSTDNWLLLSRNSCFLIEYEEYCKFNGFSYQVKGNRSPANSHNFMAIRIYESLRRGKVVYEDLTKKQLTILNKNLTEKTFTKPWYEALLNMHETEIAYFRTALSKGEKFTEKPRIQINTIHGAKGQEATNVIMMLDMTKASYEHFLLIPNDEHRVFYVGATRAKENLYILNPSTQMSYTIN